jgi:hypothetical protein
VSGEFLNYVGPPDLHDGVVRAVERHGEDATVRVRGAEGREYRLVFRGVTAVRAHRGEGMTLYAVAELRAEGPARRFAFPNWDEADDARLEIDAREMHVEPVARAG